MLYTPCHLAWRTLLKCNKTNHACCTRAQTYAVLCSTSKVKKRNFLATRTNVLQSTVLLRVISPYMRRHSLCPFPVWPVYLYVCMHVCKRVDTYVFASFLHTAAGPCMYVCMYVDTYVVCICIHQCSLSVCTYSCACKVCGVCTRTCTHRLDNTVNFVLMTYINHTQGMFQGMVVFYVHVHTM